MKLERHVGGLSLSRKANYLTARGWTQSGSLWAHADLEEPLKLSRAVHVQLTEDLAAALTPFGWTVVGYSKRGYAQLQDGRGELPPCSLPKALRVQARREKRLVGDFTYSLFLAAVLERG